MFSLVRNVSRQTSEPQWKPSPPRGNPHQRANRRERRTREDHHSPEFAHRFHCFRFYRIARDSTTSDEGRWRGSARSFHFRRTWARRGRTGPAISAVFAQNAPDKENERKNNPLNNSRRQRNRLRAPMSPQHVGQI